MAYKMTAADRRALANIQARERQSQARRSLTGNSQTVGNSITDTRKTGANPLLRGVATIADVGENVNRGMYKSLEGIVDLGAGIVGAVGGVFSDGFENEVKKFIETDWTGKLYDEVELGSSAVMGLISGGPLGLIASAGGTLLRQKTKLSDYSYLEDGGIVEQVAQGVGQMLPAVAITLATGGLGAGAAAGGTTAASGGASAALGNAAKAVGSYAVKNAGMLTVGASAAGTATEEAFNDGASYGAGMLYGAASGATEMVTERLLPGVTDTVIGKSLFGGAKKGIADQGVKRIVKGVVGDALNEGIEEMASEVTNPLRKSIYKGTEAFEEYADFDFYKGVAEAGAVGALTSAAFGGTVGKVTQGKGYNGDIQESVESIEALKKEKNRLQESGKLTTEAESEIDELIEGNYKQIETVLSKNSDEKRAEQIERYKLGSRFDSSGKLNEYVKDSAGLDSRYYSADARGQEKRIREILDSNNVTAFKGELTADESSALQEVYKAHNALSKFGYADKHVVIVDKMSSTNAFIDENVIAIGKDMLNDGQYINKLVHETTHFTEGSNEWKALTKYIFGDGKNIRQTLSMEIGEVIGHGYGVTDADVDAVSEFFSSGYKTNLTKEQRTLIEEVIANRMGNVFSDSASVEKLCREKPKLAKRIWERIKAIVDSFGKSASEREEIKKLRETEQLFRAALETGGQEYLTDTLYNTKREKRHSFKGYDEDGRGIYESNFPKGTPKAAKSERILKYIQEVWSKNPIKLRISNGETSRDIIAQFDPTIDKTQNTPTDASKLAGGNRHGNHTEQRVTLDLADDYYKIATESTYNYSKLETGKDLVTHNDVIMWHYFINEIYFKESESDELVPYTVTINVKEKADGEYVYSFNAEKEFSTQRTLHADVNTSKGANGELFLNTIIPQNSEKSTGSAKKSGKLQEEEFGSLEEAKRSGRISDAKFSLKFAPDIAENQRKYYDSHDIVLDEDELDLAINQTAEMVSLMEKYSDILPQDKVATKAHRILVKNGSYDYSVENTTVCVRTLSYNSFVDRVSEKIGRPLSQMESFLVSQKLYDIAKEPQCLYCYVSLDRKAYNEMLLRYLDQRDAAVQAYKDAGMPTVSRSSELYKDFLDSRKDTDQQWNRYKSWMNVARNGGELLTAEDIATESRRAEIFAKGGERGEQIKDILKYAQSASWAKKQMDYVAYYDEILKLSDTVVRNLNKHYGLRWYSFSDYSAAFIVENMQQITDASLRGLKGLAYTKDTDFVKVFAPTGMNINISVYAKKDGKGGYIIDEKQSANIEEAIALREQYPNVGIVVVATDHGGVEWALEQKWSDVVIPFHTVRTGADVAEFYNWEIFNSEQSDTVKDANLWEAYVNSVATTDSAKKKVSKMVYPSEHQNDKKTYLDICKSRGLNPRFSGFINNPNYMKLVNETRQSESATQPLKPVFDLDAAKESFGKFVDKGGYFEGWYNDGIDVDGEAELVANDIRAGKKANDVLYGRQDLDPDQLMAQRKGNRTHGGTVKRSGKISHEDFLGAADDYVEYDKPITLNDIMTLREIGKKSINAFSPEEIEKTQKWAYKFYKELGVKSPFFRAWFGEWREYDYETRILYVPVNSTTIERTMVPRGDFNNDDTKWDITSNSDGIDETSNKEQKRSESYHALKDIDSMIKHAILLDTIAVKDPSKRLGKNAAFMHHMYCPVEIDGKKGIAKLYIAESLGNKRKFYLVRIEKASTAMGFITENSESTPRSKATTVDADISIAEIIDFVKAYNDRFEKNSEHPTPYTPIFVNEHFINKKTGEPKVFYLSESADYNFVEGVKVYEKESDIESGEAIPVYVSSVAAGNVVPPQIQPDGSVIVYDGGQIKVVDNIGTFDRQTKKVRYSRKADGEHHEGDISADEISNVLGLADEWNAFQAKRKAAPDSVSQTPNRTSDQMAKLREQYFPGLDNGQFFAAIAKMTKDKVYSLDDANSVMGDIVSSLVYGDVKGDLRGKMAIAERIYELYNASGRRITDEAGSVIADLILEKTVIADNLKRKGVETEVSTLEAVKTLHHQLDLSDIKSQIGDKFGKKNSILLIWSKKEGGISLAEAVELLKSEGIEVKSTEPIDIISEINEIYNESKSAVEKAENERFADIMSEDELNTIREDIVRKLREGYRDLGSRSALVKLENEHRAEVKKLKEKRNELMKMMALEYTRSIQEYKFKVQENNLKNRIVKSAEWFREQKNGLFFNATQYKGDTFKKSLERIGNISRNGNLSDSLSRKIFSDLRAWYSKENPILYTEGVPEEHQVYQERIANMLQSVCEGEGSYTIAQLRTIANLLDHFKTLITNYGKAYIDGKYVEIAPLVEKYIRVINEVKKIPDMRLHKLLSKYKELFNDPITLMRLADGYQDGYCTEMYEALRKALINSEVWKMNIRRRVDAFMNGHKQFQKDLSKKTVSYTAGGVTHKIPLNQALYVYMTMNREDAFAGHVVSGFEYRDKQGKYHSVAGIEADNPLPTDYTDADIEERVKHAREQLYAEFNDTEKEYISIIESIFNNECKKAKSETDLKRDGFTHVLDGYYCPVAIANKGHQIDGDNMFFNYDLGNFSFNKSTVDGSKHQLKIMPLTEVFDRHVRQVALYSNVSLMADGYTRIFNLDIGGNQNVVKSVKSELKNVWDGAEQYIRELFEDIKGKPKKTSKVLQGLRSGYAVSAIGANPKVLATQFSSLLASVNVLDLDCITKGITVNGKGDVNKYCSLAELRDYDNAAAMAQANIDRTASAMGKVDKIGDVLMKPIGFMDRQVVQWLFGSCQLQIEKNGGAKLGTEENKKAAGKLLEKVILETQQNSLLTERSAAMRSDNIVWQTFTMFRSDAMKGIGRFFDAYGAAYYAKHRLDAAKKNGAGEAELKRLEAELKKAHDMEARAVGGLVMTSVYIYLIGLLFKFLYNKLDDEYEEGDIAGIAKDAFSQTFGNMIGGLPIISDIYAKVVDGYNIDNYAYSAVNDLIDSTQSLVTSITDKDASNMGKKLRNISYSAGQILGVPVRNIYNVLYGLTKRISPEAAYNWDDMLESKSYSADLKKAIEKGDEGMVSTIAGLVVNENAGFLRDSSLRNEMKALLEAGNDVLPRSVGESVTHNGEQLTLTNRQKSRFSALYSVAGERAAKLVKTSLYRKADNGVKSAALKFVYDTYYNLALQEVVGEELEGKNVLFAEAMDIEQLAIIVAYARSIEADKDRSGNSIVGSKKAKIERYIQSLGISAAEKYMMMGYLGYKCTNGASAVKGYINRLNLTKAEKERLYEYCGYAA